LTRTPISEITSTIDEYCVIKLNSQYPIDSTKHHLNDAFVLNRELEFPPQVGCDINTLITSIDTTISSNFGVVSEETPHSKKDVETKLERNVELKLLDRRKRPSRYGWRLVDDEEFDESHKL
jgi:hypothetical protein